MGCEKKIRKSPFLDILGQNGQFWTVFGQNGQNWNFFKKALGTFFSYLQVLTNCKVSEKVMNGFRATAWRTYGRTWILRSPTTSLRDQKWLKYRFKQPKCIVIKARKGPRMNLPTARTNFYVQEYRDITSNTKLGKIKT